MSDESPERRIEGLAPRRRTPDLSILQKRNRVTAEAEAPVMIQDDPTEVREPTQPKSPRIRTPKESAEPARPPAPTKRVSDAIVEESPSSRLTIYLSSTARDRARAAYRATLHLEGDRSWSDFVEKAILAEATRRERAYNEGALFDVDRSPLSAGRPLS